MKPLVRFAEMSLGCKGVLDTDRLRYFWERPDFETSLSRTLTQQSDTITVSDSESLIQASQSLTMSTYR